MRIAFPNSAREDLCWSQPVLRIGSAPDNDLVVGSQQGAGHHVRVQQDRRGWVLQVLPAGSRIYVNARPVRERALLRAGDIVSMGDCRMLFCADEDPATRSVPAATGVNGCIAALRALAGPLSGRVFPLLQTEAGAHCDLPLDLPGGQVVGVSVDWHQGRLWCEVDAVSERYPLRINGYAVSGPVALRPDDQLGIATHRFVVDAPGLVELPPVAAAPPPPHMPEEQAGPPGEVWWLIATAAVLALGIALALLVRF